MRLQAQVAAAKTHKPRSPILEKCAFLTNRKANTNPSTLSPTSSSTPSVDYSRSNVTSIDPRMGVDASGKLVVPLTEAPASAINSNSSERRVAVRCKQSTLDLPVEWETTTLDILSASSSCLDQKMTDINPSTSLLIETFSNMGLERRLRRYEQIRDVMNSWDKDAQNTLIVVPQDSADGDKDLEISSVPRTSVAPNGFTLYLYHSQKHGKWTKRYINLMETGQMYASKKPDFKTTDKDCHAICHLSDFDIYTPTEAQMRRHLKPPKKFCYAIKSQQKTTLFVNLENYVHYFCTEDPNVAQRFQALVHAWRSWYLVNRRVELAIKKKATDPNVQTVKHKPKKSLNIVNVHGHRPKVPVDESPYSEGTVAPLMELKRSEKPIDEFGKDFLSDPKRTPPKERGPARSGTVKSPRKPLLRPDDPEFKADGLLGQSYEARKADEAERKRDAQIHDSPADNFAFTGGDTLLNSMSLPPEKAKEEEKRPGRKPWFSSAAEHSAKSEAIVQQTRPILESRPSTSGGQSNNRAPPEFSSRFGPSSGLKPSTSVRGDSRRVPQVPGGGRTKPLVDLTPKFQEAPQWRQQGHGVRAPAGVHLVDLISTGQLQGANKYLEVPTRSMTRRETPTSSTATMNRIQQHQPQERETRGMHRFAPSAGRQRSRSIASSGGGSMPGGGSRRAPDMETPVPPLPLRVGEGAERKACGVHDHDRLRGRSGTVRY